MNDTTGMPNVAEADLIKADKVETAARLHPPNKREYRIYKTLPYPGSASEKTVVAKVLLAIITHAEVGYRPLKWADPRPLIEQITTQEGLNPKYVMAANVLRSIRIYREVWLDDLDWDDDSERLAKNFGTYPERLVDALAALGDDNTGGKRKANGKDAKAAKRNRSQRR
jgi:hypothetical protein